MAKIRAVVFDVGGTLVYTADPVGETYARFAKPHGFRLSADDATIAFHAAMKSCAREKGSVPTDGNDRVWWKKVVRASLPETAFPEKKAFETFFEEVYLYFAKPEAWGVYPEVPDMLEALRDYPVDLAVLSNWDARLHSVLDGHGLGEYFGRRFISAELGWEKPDCAIFRHVAEALQYPPHTLLSIGDDQANDVDGARKAGWEAALVDRPKCDLWVAVQALSGKKKAAGRR